MSITILPATKTKRQPRFEARYVDDGPHGTYYAYFQDGRKTSPTAIVEAANELTRHLRNQIAYTREKQDRINELTLEVGQLNQRIAWLEAQLAHKTNGAMPPQQHEHSFFVVDGYRHCICGLSEPLRF